MFLDAHVLQTAPANNMNRDDTGNPKTEVYGGKLRARVSSQAWKHVMRKEFEKTLDISRLGIRTQRAVERIAARICEQREDLTADAEKLAKDVVRIIVGKKGFKTIDKKESDQTSAIAFFAPHEIDELADLCITWHDDKQSTDKPTAKMQNEAKHIFHGKTAIDIALFGRMLANAPELNVDASSQVAHAFSVDQITPQYDYFTAVDDDAPVDNAGASMIDTTGFNSSTLYRYANINIDSLYEQLQDRKVTVQAVDAFLHAFLTSMPTGKQNSFANRTLPSVCVVMLRKEQPINMADAFEEPVYPPDNKEGDSITQRAAKRLGEKMRDIEEKYGMHPVKAWNVVVGDNIAELDAVSSAVTLPELREQLVSYLNECYEIQE